MSAESGIPTFRGSDGLWENHRIEDVATPEAWRRNPGLVLEFYNQRRKKILEAEPHRGHLELAQWQDKWDIHIVTQNIDNLHERAGSRNVLHLHGEITKARSTRNPDLVIELAGWKLDLGDAGPDGAQLRPHIVWFGEAVPMMEEAERIVGQADALVVVGTSLQVYPAAGLVHLAPRKAPVFLVDPAAPDLPGIPVLHVLRKPAGEGLAEVGRMLA